MRTREGDGWRESPRKVERPSTLRQRNHAASRRRDRGADRRVQPGLNRWAELTTTPPTVPCPPSWLAICPAGTSRRLFSRNGRSAVTEWSQDLPDVADSETSAGRAARCRRAELHDPDGSAPEGGFAHVSNPPSPNGEYGFTSRPRHHFPAADQLAALWYRRRRTNSHDEPRAIRHADHQEFRPDREPVDICCCA